MSTATYIGTSRRSVRRNGTRVPRLSCGDVVTIVEPRGKSSIVTKGDPTFGFRYVVLNTNLAR